MTLLAPWATLRYTASKRSGQERPGGVTLHLTAFVKVKCHLVWGAQNKAESEIFLIELVLCQMITNTRKFILKKLLLLITYELRKSRQNYLPWYQEPCQYLVYSPTWQVAKFPQDSRRFTNIVMSLCSAPSCTDLLSPLTLLKWGVPLLSDE